MKPQKPSFERYNRLLLAVCGSAGLMWGVDIGLIAAAVPYIKATCDFSATELSAVVAAVLLGTIFGKLVGAQCAERFGRLLALRLTAVVLAVSVPIICLSNGAFLPMFVGRILQGVGCGMVGLVTPLYMVETSPAESRGKGAGMIQLFVCIGLVVVALIGLAITSFFGAADSVAVTIADKTMAWKAIFWISAVPTVFLFGGTFFVSESPRWLFARGCRDAAKGSLLRNNDPEAAEATLAELGRIAAEQCRADGASASDRETVFQRKYMIPVLLAGTIAVCTQFCGINMILNFSVVLAQKAGLAHTLANWSDTILKGVNLGMTLVAMALVDRKGRRLLLSLGSGGMTVGLALVGTVFALLERDVLTASSTTGWLATAGLVFFIAAFAIGPGICIWLAESELLPLRIRANAMMSIGFVQMGSSWLLAQLFLPWSERFGESSVFFTLSAVCILFFVTVVVFLPETKGKTLEEIERHFSGAGSKAKDMDEV